MEHQNTICLHQVIQNHLADNSRKTYRDRPRKLNKSLPSSCTREYCMIYRGPGFLAVAWFGSSPTPSLPPSLPPSLSISSTGGTQKTEKGRQLADKRGWGGTKSYEGEKMWSSINHLIPSDHVSQSHLSGNFGNTHPGAKLNYLIYEKFTFQLSYFYRTTYEDLSMPVKSWTKITPVVSLLSRLEQRKICLPR